MLLLHFRFERSIVNRKIKILYMLTCFRVGGVQTGLIRLATHLDSERFELKIVALRPGDDFIEDKIESLGFEPANVKASKFFPVAGIWRLNKMVRDYRPDVIICSLFHASILGRVLGRMNSVPRIVSFEHNEHFGNKFRVATDRFLTRWSDLVLVDSEQVKNKSVDVLKIPESRIRTILLNGVDIEEYQTLDEARNNDSVVINSVGALEEKKGYDYLIDSASLLKQRGHRFTLQIIGDGYLRDELRSKVQRLGLESTVRFLGLRSDVPALHAAADIYVQPSLWEGACIAIVEAMASSLPVVGSAVGGIQSSVTEGESGFLVQPKDSHALADRLEQLLVSADLRRQMGAKSHTTVKEEYDVKTMVHEFEEVMSGLFSESHA
jgi:glycosyltransferase involved in cell wall biosynthesis